jgi:hypothetical protein
MVNLLDICKDCMDQASELCNTEKYVHMYAPDTSPIDVI